MRRQVRRRFWIGSNSWRSWIRFAIIVMCQCMYFQGGAYLDLILGPQQKNNQTIQVNSFTLNISKAALQAIQLINIVLSVEVTYQTSTLIMSQQQTLTFHSTRNHPECHASVLLLPIRQIRHTIHQPPPTQSYWTATPP